MNNTNDYSDQLEGDALACEPGNVAEGLDFVCNYGMPMLGWSFLTSGLWSFVLACIKRRHRNSLVRPTKDAASVHVNVQKSVSAQSKFCFTEKILLSLGVSTFGIALMFLVNGFGTMYGTTHIRGQIGDVVAGITFSAWWYLSLLQHRGVTHFKTLVPRPQGSIRHVSSSNRLRLPTLSQLADILQSWLSPVIALVLWALLYAGVYTRGWYMFCISSVQGVCGMRSFASILFQRLSTLKRIAKMVTAKHGTNEENRRRSRFLTNTMISIIIDLFGVFCVSVLLPVLIVVCGTTFNSRQLAIHIVVLSTLSMLALTVSNVHLHSAFNKSKKKNRLEGQRKMLFFKGENVNANSKFAQSASTSIVKQSEV